MFRVCSTLFHVMYVYYCTFSYESCCWVDLVSHDGRGWKLGAAIDLMRRSDTGHINSSPISESLPVQFMEKGCTYALQIPGRRIDVKIWDISVFP